MHEGREEVRWLEEQLRDGGAAIKAQREQGGEDAAAPAAQAPAAGLAARMRTRASEATAAAATRGAGGGPMRAGAAQASTIRATPSGSAAQPAAARGAVVTPGARAPPRARAPPPPEQSAEQASGDSADVAVVDASAWRNYRTPLEAGLAGREEGSSAENGEGNAPSSNGEDWQVREMRGAGPF